MIEGGGLFAAALACCVNPHPVRLLRPGNRPLSPAAVIGRAIFFDRRLSGAGNISCASCHSPAAAYAPPNERAVQLGGVSGHREGARAVPTLRYLDRIPVFGVGPDVGDADHPAAGGATAVVAHGGLFWDGRANTLQTQAVAPLLDASEMANGGSADLAKRLGRFTYTRDLARVFGAEAVATPQRLLDEALFAVARFELEDPSFHPYRSKYDRYLEGLAPLSAAEARGLRVFEDSAKGNCASCHLDRPDRNGRPPVFTDYQYEALGVPRNEGLAVNRDARHYDLGLCGPVRTDLASQRGYCGMFRTPSLRNVATRHTFFHNGVYRSLSQVLRFYNLRDTHPERIYPVVAGHVDRYNDLPPSLRRNVDVRDAPFGRQRGAPPPMTANEMNDVIAFLRTLTDGYAKRERSVTRGP